MKILYITQYFYPEIGATTNRALANVRCLSNKGHKVTVLTEMPNHPKGIIFEGYRNRIFIKEKVENFNVNRVWVFTSIKKNFITRMLFYISFMCMGAIHSIFNWQKYDIIYVTSPPLFVGVIGLILKKFFRKVKFVFEVRDLWPDSAVELGELKNNRLIKMSLILEKKCYTTAEKIIAISNHMKKKIVMKVFNQDKIIVIHNGTDNSFLENDERNLNNILHYDKSKNKFTVIYAGILGVAQGLGIMIKAASKLKNENIQFLFIGSGPKESELRKLSNDLQQKNVSFIGEIPRSEIMEYLYIADCGIIPLRNLNLFKGALPSKIFDYMACGLPILLGIEGEAKKIIEDSEAGLFFEPENIDDLIKKILFLKDNPELLQKMSVSGKVYVRKNFNREKLAEKLEKELLELMDKK